MTCSCEFYADDPVAHDWLLGIESTRPAAAAGFVADIISAEDLGTAYDHRLFLPDADDFGRFVAQHNWSAPAAMYRLGQQVDWVMNLLVERRVRIRQDLDRSRREAASA